MFFIPRGHTYLGEMILKNECALSSSVNSVLCFMETEIQKKNVFVVQLLSQESNEVLLCVWSIQLFHLVPTTISCTVPLTVGLGEAKRFGGNYSSLLEAQRQVLSIKTVSIHQTKYTWRKQKHVSPTCTEVDMLHMLAGSHTSCSFGATLSCGVLFVSTQWTEKLQFKTNI